MNDEPAPSRPRDDEPCLLLFSKPSKAGRVKTRLVGALSAEQAAELHAAFLGDLCERLAAAPGFELRLAWALEAGETVPPGPFLVMPLPAMVQRGRDLGERLHHALTAAAARHRLVAAVGSDHPALSADRVEEAFAALDRGADVVLGPALDGGYYLIAVRREALSPRLFAEVPWSTAAVLQRTVERCDELGLAVTLLPAEPDVDTPEDLARLVATLQRSGGAGCPRTSSLLRRWGMLTAATTTTMTAATVAPVPR